MPLGRQPSTINVPTAAIPPLAGARAGTVNPAGGLSAAIDARGYKSATLCVYAGVVTATTGAVTGKVQSSATSGGSYADITGAAVEAFGPDDDNELHVVDFEIDPGEPYLKVVVTTVEATDVSAAWVVLNGKMRV